MEQGKESVCLSPWLCDPVVVPLAVLSLLVERDPFLFSNSWEDVSQTFFDYDIRNQQTKLIRN